MGSTGKSTNVSSGIFSVIMPDGTNISLSEELVYGADKGRSQLPQNVIDFENKRKPAKIEYILLTDADGNELESRKGGKNGVKSSLRANSQATIATHNHPRSKTEAGALGGTFSVQDLNNFATFSNQKTVRAVAGEGTYSITKVPGQFNRSLVRAFNDYGREIYKELKITTDAAYKAYRNISDTAYNDWRNNRISRDQMNDLSSKAYAEYEKTAKKVFNTELTRKHNWLIDNQKTYGYTYGLER